jgi:hypothetical protein
MNHRRLRSLFAISSLGLLAACGSPAGEGVAESSSALTRIVPIVGPSVWQAGFTAAGIVAGLDIDGTPLYPCRATLPATGLWTPGKTRHDWSWCAVSYGGAVYSETTYQTLVPEWIAESSGAVPANALPVGKENGQTLYACRATFGETLEVGKTGAGIAGCSIPYDGIELVVTSYEVLSTPNSDFGFLQMAYGGGVMPYNAIQAGTDATGAPVYPCFVSYQGSLLAGETRVESGGSQLYCEIAFNGSAVPAGVEFNYLVPSFGPANGQTFVAGQDTGGGALGICSASGPEGSLQVGKYIPSAGLCDYPFGTSEMAAKQFDALE